MREVRKTVTVLFADVVASTELGERLDPEAVREVVSRYFTEMAQVIERHGGTVEKFIGDEVMAVFGVPTVHEDDALRAVRAASAMRDRVEGLNHELEERCGGPLEIRIGVNTGEVVAGDPSSGHAFVTGTMVNLAKRIEQAAKPGEILIGDETSKLVQHAVVTTLVGPVAVKGKRDPMVMWRLEEVDSSSEAFPRRLDAPLVGRALEVDALRTAYRRALETRRPQLVTVLGPAGIGKSRLAWELLEELTGEAEVRVGRCLPYGEGITFWPVREVLPDELFEGTTEEIFRRVRMQLQEIARERPLVMCFEDVHWGEPTFLDLVQYLAGWMRDASVLFLCLARPDLLERRPDWAPTGPDTSTLRLGRLSDEDAATMLDHLSPRGEIRARITEAAEGNPLFVEQMAALAAEERGDVTVPPSIWALLTARLDRLDAGETAVIERAAVIGREFPLEAVIDLSPPELHEHVAARLLGLVRKELVRPSTVGDDDRFRFRHALIRDAAYDAMPKALRAELHERHAAWLESSGHRELIVGYHLEQAVHFRRELALYDDSTARLAARAGELLGEAGQRAFRRADMPAARSLLGRARALLGEDNREHLEYSRDLANALWVLGEIDEADSLLQDVVEAATDEGDRRLEWYARLDRAQRHSQAGGVTGDEFVQVANSAIAIFEELGERSGLARARRGLAIAALREGSYGRAADEIERAIAHSEPGLDRNADARNADVLGSALLFGPAPADYGSRRCRRLLRQAGGNVELEAHVSVSLAGLEAMQGRLDEARALFERSRDIYVDLGLRIPLVGLTQISGLVELLAGDPEAAERVLRQGYDELLAIGAAGGYLAPQAALLALALIARDRDQEAEPLLLSAEDSLTEDIPATVLTRTCRSRIELRRGEPGKALAAAESAVRLAEQTDALNLTAEALGAAARACAKLDLADRAMATLDRTLQLYNAKGNIVGARQAEALLAEAAV